MTNKKFKLGDVVITKSGWWFQIDKIKKPSKNNKEFIYYDVSGQGATQSNLKLVDKNSKAYKYYHQYKTLPPPDPKDIRYPLI